MLQTLKDLPRSFYSQDFYRDVIRRQQGYGGRFFLILLVLLSLHIAAGMLEVAQKMHAAIPGFFSNMPEITLTDGKLTAIDKPMPFTLRLDGMGVGESALVIDIHQPMDDPQALQDMMEKKNIFILLASDRMAILESGHVEVSPLNLQEMSTVITRTHWDTASGTLQGFVYPVFGLAVFVGAIFGAALRAIVGGVIALILSLPFGAALDYTGGVRLATVTAIPCTIFMLLLPLRGITFYALWTIYMLFALWSNKMLGQKNGGAT